MQIKITDAMVAKAYEYGFDPMLDGKTPHVAHFINARAAVEAILKEAFPDAELVDACSVAGAAHVWSNTPQETF